MNKKEKQEILNQKALRGGMNLFIPEIFEFVGTTKSKDDKLAILRNNSSPAMLTILRLTYSSDITFLMSFNEVKKIEFEDMDIADYTLAPSTLYREHKRLNIYTNERGLNLRKTKLHILMSQLLSSLYNDDREIVIHMHKRKLPFNGLTENLVREAFPDLLPEVKENDE